MTLELYGMLTTIGKKQWTKFSHDIIKTTRYLARAVNAIPGLKVFGNPSELLNIVAIELDKEYWAIANKQAPSIYAVADILS